LTRTQRDHRFIVCLCISVNTPHPNPPPQGGRGCRAPRA
jgi:hypothetical protein